MTDTQLKAGDAVRWNKQRGSSFVATRPSRRSRLDKGARVIRAGAGDADMLANK
jgi:hypothetical protein